MKSLFFAVILVMIISVRCLAQDDAQGCKDSPMFNRMPYMSIGECKSSYDEMEIPLGSDLIDKKEGMKTTIQYNYILEEASAPSFFQIVKNFENAIVKTAGKRVYYSRDAGVATLFTKLAGKDIWVVLRDFGGTKTGNFELNILEIEEMKQEITAGALFETLNKSGSVALYINFETGKAVIQPESQTIVDQIAQMLKENASLRISVEGHTDNVGTPQFNLILSQNRSTAVMNAIVSKGIVKARLTAKGWGQTKPVADNTTDDGKAKNRRVEIVKL